MQVMQFARNEYVRVVDERGGRRKQRIGKWRMGHSGVAFDVPVHVTSVGPMGRGGGAKRAGGGGLATTIMMTTDRCPGGGPLCCTIARIYKRYI